MVAKNCSKKTQVGQFQRKYAFVNTIGQTKSMGGKSNSIILIKRTPY